MQKKQNERFKKEKYLIVNIYLIFQMIFQILKAHCIEHPNRNNRMNKLIYIPNKTCSYTSTNLRNKIKTIVQNNIISHPLTNHLSSSSQFQFRSIISEKFDNPPT